MNMSSKTKFIVVLDCSNVAIGWDFFAPRYQKCSV